ncbi:hypothetical protein [Pseudomonas fluorescens]|uniref:Uncharacterized protein n=1 Tax=Pseudomonas fluorescens TaxID=294 RepID=A0A0F4TEH8_PSEFL|nr:hypothetical protein [Pseudomonas fluorescens]KJZ42469.1 hypothetical protein VC35_23415 [Pseudomonas fluorescens]
MRVSSKIGKVLAVTVMLMTFGVLSEECMRDNSNLQVSHELKTKKNLICIVRGNDEVVIFVYRNSEKNVPLSRNVMLLEKSDIAEEVVRLEPFSDGFRMYLEYPNNIYIVGVDADAEHIVESSVLVKINAVVPDAPPQQMSLVLTSNVLSALRFETLTRSQAFDQGVLSLEKPLSARITAQKTKVSYLPGLSSLSEMHLAQGDSVDVVGFKGGWIKINYKASNDLHESSGWVLLADIL